MTGFPGETDAEFEESRSFIESLPFTYLHVFTYSERPGTPAAESADQVPKHVRKERTHVLRELAREKGLAFRKSMVGKTLSVVTIEDGRVGLSSNYLKVGLTAGREANRLETVRIGGVSGDSLTEAGLLHVI